MENKCCSRCNEIKDFDKFIKRRNICKECSNKWAKKNRETRYITSVENNETKICKVCNIEKPLLQLIKNRFLCKDCNNKHYKDLYKNKIGFREKVLLKTKNKDISNKAQRKRYQNNPTYKFIRVQRSRISIALKNKQLRSIDYLGCNSTQYINWLKYNFNENYNFENYGNQWHIDHVIPIHNFDMNNKEEQLIALNWRNTMPLFSDENLKKGVKICTLQIEQHYKKLIDYHKENNIELPQIYIELFAKHLVAGIPLEPNQSNKLDNHYQVCCGNAQMAEI
jgi:hypothetical protein